jgi:hypothetical protein
MIPLVEINKVVGRLCNNFKFPADHAVFIRTSFASRNWRQRPPPSPKMAEADHQHGRSGQKGVGTYFLNYFLFVRANFLVLETLKVKLYTGTFIRGTGDNSKMCI